MEIGPLAASAALGFRAEGDATPPAKPGKKVKTHRELRITVGTSSKSGALGVDPIGNHAGRPLGGNSAGRPDRPSNCRSRYDVLAPVRRMAVAASGIGRRSWNGLPAIITNDEKLASRTGPLTVCSIGCRNLLNGSGDLPSRRRISFAPRSPAFSDKLRWLCAASDLSRSTNASYPRFPGGELSSPRLWNRCCSCRVRTPRLLAALESVCLSSWLPEQIEAWSDDKRATEIVFRYKNPEPSFVLAHPALLGESLNVLVYNACRSAAPETPSKSRSIATVAMGWAPFKSRIEDVELPKQTCGICSHRFSAPKTPGGRGSRGRDWDSDRAATCACSSAAM